MAWYVKEIGLTDWFKKKFLGLEEVVVRARNKKGQYVKDDPKTKKNEAYTKKTVKRKSTKKKPAKKKTTKKK